MATQLQIDKQRLADFSERHSVLELAVFGSAVRDDCTEDSDIDLLVTFAPGAEVSLFDLVDMADELGKLFGRPVDLVPKKGLKPRIRHSVLESSEIIYSAA